MPKETGMMFKGPLVRAILEGRKTQTRRPLKTQPPQNFMIGDIAAITNGKQWAISNSGFGKGKKGAWPPDPKPGLNPPYGLKGDLIYVRETWMDMSGTGVEHRPDPRGPLQRYAYAADTPPGSYGDAARKDYGLKWKPSIHMPKAAARSWLEITGVRVERLQSITAEDCIAEGLSTTLREHDAEVHLRQQFTELWESTGGDWAANPWVWVYDFKRIDPPKWATA